ncbi:TonB-dependent receptor [Sphingomonas adhaesiva]|uniref:TonB-dependent receptor n=1 Tax=Sphingomonas adhaesiva TaxID=28212 RepID=UPI002FF9AD3B
MSHRFIRRALFVTAAGAALTATAAFAQDGSVPQTPAQASQGVGSAAAGTDGLDDIVVTAERREENLQRVPLSVTAVKGEELRTFQTGGEDILALAGRVPGLYAETTTGRIFPRFYIRGLGNIDFYLGASQPVSIIQDDVVLEHVVLKSNPVFDVAQVEVLRGPQGSLFGRNTPAGIIKFDTIRPSQETQGRMNLSVGSFDTVSLDAGVGGPLIKDVLSFRVSGLMQRRSDWIDNTYTGPSDDGTITPRKDALGGFLERDARLQLLFTPGDVVSLLLSGHVRDYEGTSTVFHRNALVKGSSTPRGPRDQVALDEGGDNPQAYKMQGASAHLGIDLGVATLTSITAYEHASGYSRGDTDGGAGSDYPFNGVRNGFGQSQGRIRDLDQWTQEVRVASNGDGAFKWQFGGIYFDSRDLTEFDQRGVFLTTASRNPNNFVVLRNTNTSWAGFGQASYAFTDRLTLTAGARYTNDTKRTQLLRANANAAGVSSYTGRRDVRLSDEQPSWDVSLAYQATPDLNLYARAARGFRGPTIQGRSAVFNADFTTANSETNTSFEGGFKSSLLGNTLRINGALFFYTVEDIQLNGNDSNGSGVLFNADKAQAYGGELEIDWRPVRNLAIGLGASALHSEIKDKRVFAQTCSLNGVQVCTVLESNTFTRGTGTGTTYFANIDGNRLPNAPEYNLDLTAQYDVPLANGGALFAATDWNLQGLTNLVLYDTAEFRANGNVEGGLKIGYRTPDDRFEIAAFARNITNEENLKGVIENYMAAVYNEPRVIGISLSARSR